ncbi:MAG: presqualene diphosphate synthase HpnD [Mariprofundaceae bacterium]|nr:presqualene diphosphate synthase HpnD [Mariprofundaceae bacterium]
MTPQDYCQQRTRDSGSSFFYALNFLPDIKRRGMMALYAFCREVDDVADEVKDQRQATQKIEHWRHEIHDVFHAQPEHSVGKELQWACQHFAWDEELFYELIDGMLTDISCKPFIKESDLKLYCYRVAGVVGLLSIEVFGYQQRQSRHFASSLGEALQLTNILRDIAEDIQRERIYLPQQVRSQFHVSDQDLREGNMTPELQHLLHHYQQKAEQAYQHALNSLPLEDRISLRPSIIMAAIYHAQFEKMKTFDFDVWKHSGRISSWQKIRIAWRTWRYEKKYARQHDNVRYPLTWHIK